MGLVKTNTPGGVHIVTAPNGQTGVYSTVSSNFYAGYDRLYFKPEPRAMFDCNVIGDPVEEDGKTVVRGMGTGLWRGNWIPFRLEAVITPTANGKGTVEIEVTDPFGQPIASSGGDLPGPGWILYQNAF